MDLLNSINGLFLLPIVIIELFCIMFAVYFFRGILTKVALFIALPIFYGGVGIFLGELIFGYGSYFGCSAVNDFGSRSPESFNTLSSAIINGIAIGFVSPLIIVFAIVVIILWFAKSIHVPQPIYENPLPGDISGIFDRVIGFTRPSYGCGCFGLPLLVLTLASPLGGAIAGYGINQQIIYSPDLIAAYVGGIVGFILGIIGAIIAVIRILKLKKFEASERVSITILAVTFGATAFVTTRPIANTFGYSLDLSTTLFFVVGSFVLGAIIGIVIVSNAPKYW